MVKPRYKWSNGTGISSLRAQIVGEELERIRNRNGGKLKNADVVSEAKNKKSPLHRYFDWDNSTAAMKWRLDQAGVLIRSVEVLVEISKGKQKDLRAFVSVERESERSYTSLADAMSDAELRAQVLQDAFGELQSWRERYSNLSEFSKVFAAIDKVKPSKAA